MTKLKINPEFEELQPQAIIKHVQSLTKNNAIPHHEILDKLHEQIEPIDFQELAFPKVLEVKKGLVKLNIKQAKHPENESIKNEIMEHLNELKKFKVKTKHELVISIEQILATAKTNKWSICKNHDFIYLYNGAFWSEFDKEVFQKFLGKGSEKLGIEKYSARVYTFREQLFKQFLGTAYLPVPENNKNKVLINLNNGTFEINDKKAFLRKFDENDFLTYQLPFDYDPEAEAPLFKKYLNTVLPNKELQLILAEYLGFVFIKHGNNQIKEEKALILYGTGANGKSVFFEVVSALLGEENTSHFSLQNLTNENGYFRAKIANKLVNYASEINGKLESSIFKQLVSGEPVEARLPYGQPFTLKQYAKLIFNCNELPKDVEHTNAYFRRFLIVPFEVTIPTKDQDKQLHNKIINNELSGVFNWVLDGLNRLLTQKKFTESEAVQNTVEQYKKESDSVKMFLDEYDYKSHPTHYKLIKDLFTDYRIFCNEDGFFPVNKTNFKKRLSSYGIQVGRINIGNVAYLSIQL